jgi:hypothetical protein
VVARNYELVELATYAYCSMQFHLRFDLRLPWVAASAEAAFAMVAREATREYFRCVSVPSLRSRAQRNAVAVLNSGMTILSKAFPKASVLTRRIEHFLAMAKVETLFVAGRDTPIGFDIPAEVSVTAPTGPGETDVISVRGVLDFAFWKNVALPDEHAVVISVVSDDDPLEDFVNLESLRGAFAVQAIRDGKHYDVRVEHKPLPLFDRTKRPKTLTSPQRHAAFGALVRAADRGITNRVFIPQASPTKCQHCPYAPVCSASMAEKGTDGLQVEKVEDPFAGWLGRAS